MAKHFWLFQRVVISDKVTAHPLLDQTCVRGTILSGFLFSFESWSSSVSQASHEITVLDLSLQTAKNAGTGMHHCNELARNVGVCHCSWPLGMQLCTCVPDALY